MPWTLSLPDAPASDRAEALQFFGTPNDQLKHYKPHLPRQHRILRHRALILGAHPALDKLPWPWRTRVQPINRLNDLSGQPLATLSQDFVLCDLASFLLSPQAGTQFLHPVRQVLKPQGRLIARVFVTEDDLTLDQVFERVELGRIRHCLDYLLMLAHALQASPESGVSLKTLWLAHHLQFPSDLFLATMTGWSLAELASIGLMAEDERRLYLHPADALIARAKDYFGQATLHPLPSSPCVHLLIASPMA